MTTSLLTFATIGLPGCLDHPVKEVEYEGSIEGDGTVLIEGNREVDVLFVIDNSGSMAEEQALLAANFEAFVDELDAVDANYRIGIITTDNGNPRDPKAVFDGGELRLSSCQDRLSPDGVSGGDFIYGDFNAEFACNDHCSLTDDQLVLRPSAGKLDGDDTSTRKWLENIDGGTNLSGEVTIAEAFQCFGPQGINGSGFEAPLESMYRALLASDNASSANYGFLRENAHLAVIFITDEVDCSFNPDFTEIFQDNTTFWSDPDGQIPTSAVCWNAGTQCKGPGPVYEGCEPADYGIDGAPAATENDAVMLPLARYVDLLAEIQELNEDRKVMVAAIAGVPVGYGEGEPIPYAQSEDPADQ
ncbi:MAG TPA: VWA domain-containing protein, partial [Nannocystis exedens]|nr:VWA domain-containing protein [Nannocystis exedens]